MDKRLVIIPTYNEKENIANIIRAIFSLIDVHILVIDDGSPDGTASIVKDLIANEFPGKLFIEEREGKLGLGTAYIHGFKWGLKRNYDFLFEMDADFSHDPHDLQRLYDACVEQNADLAIGSRYCSGVNVLNWPMGRLLMSYCGSMYVRFILGIPVRDTTAGFKCYRANTLRAIDFSRIKHVGYGFQIEMKYTTWKLGFKIVEVPIIFRDRTKGTSKMSSGIFKEAIFGVIGLRLRNMFHKWERLPLDHEIDMPTKEEEGKKSLKQSKKKSNKDSKQYKKVVEEDDADHKHHEQQQKSSNKKSNKPADNHKPEHTDNHSDKKKQNRPANQNQQHQQNQKPKQQSKQRSDKNKQNQQNQRPKQQQPKQSEKGQQGQERQNKPHNNQHRRPPRKPSDNNNKPAAQNAGPKPDKKKEQ